MNVTDVMYGMRDMAGHAADKLRIEIAAAQKILDELDQFANDAEDGAQLIAASDLEPTASALIPERAGLIKKPNPASAAAGGVIQQVETTGKPWKVSDASHYGVHPNVAHQNEMNGETNGPGN